MDVGSETTHMKVLTSSVSLDAARRFTAKVVTARNRAASALLYPIFLTQIRGNNLLTLWRWTPPGSRSKSIFSAAAWLSITYRAHPRYAVGFTISTAHPFTGTALLNAKVKHNGLPSSTGSLGVNLAMPSRSSG